MTEPFPDQSADVDADHMVETPESLRDDDPEAMPMDRGREASDRPLGADRFGTTPAEQQEGESLDQRLAEELPDVGEHDPIDDIVAEHPEEFPMPAEEAEETDETVLADTFGDVGDVGDDGDDGGRMAGRLVEPDEGAHEDTEKDAVARAVGRDGGDLSAEELAVRVEEQP
jgi:hypothetical protein